MLMGDDLLSRLPVKKAPEQQTEIVVEPTDECENAPQKEIVAKGQNDSKKNVFGNEEIGDDSLQDRRR